MDVQDWETWMKKNQWMKDFQKKWWGCFLFAKKTNHLWQACFYTYKEDANEDHVETWFEFKESFLNSFLMCDHIYIMMEHQKDFRQGALLVQKYKDRFNKLVKYIPHLYDKDKQIFSSTCFQSSIKDDVKVLIALYTWKNL